MAALAIGQVAARAGDLPRSATTKRAWACLLKPERASW